MTFFVPEFPSVIEVESADRVMVLLLGVAVCSSEGTPAPLAFTARTLKPYSVPLVSPVTGWVSLPPLVPVVMVPKAP